MSRTDEMPIQSSWWRRENADSPTLRENKLRDSICSIQKILGNDPIQRGKETQSDEGRKRDRREKPKDEAQFSIQNFV